MLNYTFKKFKLIGYESTVVCARYSFRFLQVCLLVQIPRERLVYDSFIFKFMVGPLGLMTQVIHYKSRNEQTHDMVGIHKGKTGVSGGS